MALPKSGRRDLDELRLARELRDRRGADVAHPALHAAAELVDEARERTALRHEPLHALGHELVALAHLALPVAIGAVHHRADRAHAADLLVGPAAEEDGLARRLVDAGEERAEHHAACADRERL